jgi:LL-diaminopimelate aminotransferase
VVKPIPLLPEDVFLPRLDDLEGCRLVFINYPNNPTGALANRDFYERLAFWMDEHPDTVVAHDSAYSEMTFDQATQPSILEFTRNAIEFHSISKTFNATGYRMGFAVGRREYIDGLVKVKTQLDSGAPLFIQRAAVDSLKTYNGPIPPAEVLECHKIYARRKKLVERGLTELGYQVFPSLATFYVWFRIPGDEDVWLERALNLGVVVTPGMGFGQYGRGFARIAVTVPEERLIEAIERIRKI